MINIGYLVVVLVFTIPLVIAGGVVLAIINALRGGRGGNEEEDVRMIQEIHKGLSKLEDRIDSLEAILLDREGPDVRKVKRP